jgi:hypothetical protein
MTDFSYVLDRVNAGDRVVFGRDPYGQSFVELWRGRLIPRCARVTLSPEDVRSVKRLLLSRTAAHAPRPSGASAASAAPH